MTQLIDSLSNNNTFYKKPAYFILWAVTKNSPQLADDEIK